MVYQRDEKALHTSGKTQDYTNNPTLANYLLDRLFQLGIEEIFGIPGDYSFPINDAICFHKNIRWIQTSTELGASYAAHGYARAKGFGAICTTFGVGELNAINGIAGAYVDNCPVFHIVGIPRRTMMEKNLKVHHSFNDGRWGVFHDASKPVVCDSAVITPKGGAQQIDNLIYSAIIHRRPVYIAIAFDEVDAKIDAPLNSLKLPLHPLEASTVLLGTEAGYKQTLNATNGVADSKNQIDVRTKNGQQENGQYSKASDDLPLSGSKEQFESFITQIAQEIASCDRGVVVLGEQVDRYSQLKQAEQFINECELPFTVLASEKGLLSEDHHLYIGVSQGNMQNPEVNKYLENCDNVIYLGEPVGTDWNSGFTFKIPKANIKISAHETTFEAQKQQAYIGDIIESLIAQLRGVKKQRNFKPKYQIQNRSLMTTEGFRKVENQGESLKVNYIYYHLQQLLKSRDYITCDMGSASIGFIDAKLPPQSHIWVSGNWMSIGASLPQALGIQFADKQRRVIILTGEGAHQMTAQEIGTFQRYRLKPIIFVFNNSGYHIERVLGTYPDAEYNDLQPWRYSLLPKVFCCDDWIVEQVKSPKDFMQALQLIENNKDKAVYLEVMLDRYTEYPYFQRLMG